MADVVKKIKIKKQDGTFTDYIPIGADATNVIMSNEESVETEIKNLKKNLSNVTNVAQKNKNDIEAMQDDFEEEQADRMNNDTLLLNQINGEKNTRASADTNLQNQINAIVAPSGSSVISNEEITNARVAADFLNSTEYSTLGESIRGQITSLNNIITDLDTSIVIDRTSTSAKILKELYIKNLYNFSIVRIGIYKAYYSSSNNKYINIIRIWFDVSNNKYVDAFYNNNWSTQGQAENEFENEINNKIIYFNKSDEHTNNKMIQGAIIINADIQEIGTQTSYALGEIRDVTELGYSPKVMGDMLINKQDIQTSHELTQATEHSIGASNSYQCIDQFKKDSFIKVYQNGMLVNPNQYTLYKQGKIVFNENVNYLPSQILFEYDKSTKIYEDFENDLSESINGFTLAKENGYTDSELYEFVNDPAGGNDTVLKCYCNEIKATKVRVQWNRAVSATEFTDSVKMYVPQELLDAFISYNGAITWFGFGGAWCPFGGTVGSTQDMFSGQGNGFDLYKIAGESKVRYYIKNRFKAYSTSTGEEIYTVQSSGLSDFEVKGNEWITIKRELKVGNPGYCKMTVIDSDGEHILTTGTQNTNNIAYLGVADPENEIIRYGNQMAEDIPYRKFQTINLMKIYTSNAIAQHCINENGECALYFKDYSLSAKEVNTF